MEQFTLEIAETAFTIQCSFSSTRVYFQNYVTSSAPQARITVTEADRAREQSLLDEEADREGLRRRIFQEPFLERSAIQRKIAQALAERGVLLLHGSTVAVDGAAYLFTADCGVGKSTHTRLWRELLGMRAVMLNDDRAFLKRTPQGVLAYGSPWSGKHGLDTNLCVPLAGICLLERGQENRIARIPPDSAAQHITAQLYPVDIPNLPQLTQELLSTVPLWQMQCTKDLEAARMAYEAMRK